MNVQNLYEPLIKAAHLTNIVTDDVVLNCFYFNSCMHDYKKLDMQVEHKHITDKCIFLNA